MRNLLLGLWLYTLTSNRKPWIWFNLRDPGTVSPEEIQRIASEGLKGMVAACQW